MAKKEKKGGAESEQKAALLKELRALIKDIDEEGLRFLVKQANVLIYNAKVDELNAKRAASTAGKSKRKGEKDGSSEAASDASADSVVFFEPGKHSGGFLMDIDGNRFVMDQEEVMSLVRIAQKAPSKIEAQRRLYRWIDKHRDDVLLDVDLPPGGKRMKALHERLRSDFSISN